MSTTEPTRVISHDGIAGTVVRAERTPDGAISHVLVQFEGAAPVLIGADMLVAQDDGRYYVPITRADLERHGKQEASADEAIVIPLAAEELAIGRRVVETGRVRLRTVVREREEVVDEPLLREEAQIERVTVNRILDRPAEVRREGDTLVIPLMEEVLVVEKRLVLREELRVSLRQSETRQPQTVTLRHEDVEIERTEQRQPSGDAR